MENTVVGHMQEKIEPWKAADDRRAILLGCYTLMTQNMLDTIDAGGFEDARWVYRLVNHFAGY